MITKEHMIDYLQCDISSFGFQDLYDLVISKKNCVNCGACLSICPRIGLNENEPILIDYDPQCSLCFKYCPRTFFPKELFEKELFNEKIQKDFLLGIFQKITVARSIDNNILNNAQNGGVVTALLINALNLGLIDGVIMANKDEDWRPKPIIARTPEEVIDAAGSIYAMIPTLSIYKKAVYDYEIENLGFVGLPCQIQAVRKFQLWPPLSDKYGKFKLIIGLFCSSNYSYNSLYNIIHDLLGVSPREIKKLDVSHGKFIVYLINGTVKNISIKDTSKFHYLSCEHCKDYTAEFADISVGSVGALSDNWNSVIIRSNTGQKLFNDALKKGKIINSNKLDLIKIKKASKKKKTQIMEMSDKIYSALKLFNITKPQVKVYTTLLSLREADLSLLSEIMKLKPEIVYNILKILEQRKWISKNKNFYRPINPSQVLKNEINQYLSKFKNHVNIIKRKILKDLNTIFIQNNLMDVENLDFMDIIF
ncbi:MAG: Coenzyme F420 hydrogenase/dehydrogenase, beta subunit C-terminal domain [Candidatus Hodarchaeota archaeon]